MQFPDWDRDYDFLLSCCLQAKKEKDGELNANHSPQQGVLGAAHCSRFGETCFHGIPFGLCFEETRGLGPDVLVQGQGQAGAQVFLFR